MTPTPYERARQWYVDNEQPHPFSHYLIDCALNGFVFTTPDFFIMGYATTRASLAKGFKAVFPKAQADCWFVVFATGDLSKAWSILPYYLPFMAFERVRSSSLELTVLSTDRIRNATELPK